MLPVTVRYRHAGRAEAQTHGVCWMSNLISVLRASKDLVSSLKNVPRSGSGFDNNQTAMVKRHVSTAYSVATGLMNESEFCWNWGMHRDDVREELRSKLNGNGFGESDGFSEELYYYALRATQRDAPRPRRMLEVGCGPGWGLDMISRLEEGSSFVGLDLSPKAIEFATQHAAKNDRLKFVQGDAEALPFGDAEFDVVLNIESSHNYPHVERFFAEAVRVLKPGGYLVHADMLTSSFHAQLGRIRSDLSHAVDWLVDEDISEWVRASVRTRMDPNSFFRRTVRECVAMPGRVVIEPMMMNVYGNVFVRENYGLLSTLFRSQFNKVLNIDTYRLALGRRKADVRPS
jgi:ubiquinone/menaquinone biosynthesis C-methylase UbiE